jgi:hypothetical protein
MVSRKVDPLSKTDNPLLPIIQVLVQALFGTKLLMRKSVANKAEATLARFAAGLCLRGRNSENGGHSVALFTAGHRAQII